MKKCNPPWFWCVPKSSMSVEHAKTIGKHRVFVACMHHAREPAPFLCEKGLVVESGAVFDDEDDHDDDHNNNHQL